VLGVIGYQKERVTGSLNVDRDGHGKSVVIEVRESAIRRKPGSSVSAIPRASEEGRKSTKKKTISKKSSMNTSLPPGVSIPERKDTSLPPGITIKKDTSLPPGVTVKKDTTPPPAVRDSELETYRQNAQNDNDDDDYAQLLELEKARRDATLSADSPSHPTSSNKLKNLICPPLSDDEMPEEVKNQLEEPVIVEKKKSGLVSKPAHTTFSDSESEIVEEKKEEPKKRMLLNDVLKLKKKFSSKILSDVETNKKFSSKILNDVETNNV